MGEGLRIAVGAWCAWTPGRETPAAWSAWAKGVADGDVANATGDANAAPAALPMILRRRATPLGQKLIGAALACGDAARAARYVLASRHGEMTRTVGILDTLTQGELPSPAEFSMSVHHGLAGLLSIHTGNRAGHTALAAGADSFGFGLLEAALSLHERPEEPVLLLYGDAPLPDGYAAFDGEEERRALPLALAVALGPAGAGADTITVGTAPRTDVDAQGPSASTALDFLRFLLSGAASATSAGTRRTWAWHRVA
ncbi:hypothetical protein [Azospirillum doebereinerae]